MGDGAFDVMDVGRMAIVQDPVGATIFVWEPRESIGATLVNDPGSLTWNDLGTTDPEAAERFYSELFGWSFQEVPGPVDYWTIANDGRANGGMRRQSDEEVADGTPPNWMPYFGVESSEDAVAKVEELGGQVIVPTSEVPAGKFTVVRDPQGAVFATFDGDADD
jgi:predicted enzyme related to lactoylglutathione lyase